MSKTLSEQEIERYCERLYHFAANDCMASHAKGSWRDKVNSIKALALSAKRNEADAEKFLELSTPEIHDFMVAVEREAAHQRDRWRNDHDAGKTAEDWLWLVAYLSTKASQASRYKDRDKYFHHIITAAAACCNWHAYATEQFTGMRAGTDDPNAAIDAAKGSQ